MLIEITNKDKSKDIDFVYLYAQVGKDANYYVYTEVGNRGAKRFSSVSYKTYKQANEQSKKFAEYYNYIHINNS